VRTDDFDYLLPEDLIAQQPAAVRDQSRLLVLDRATGQLAHRAFPDLAACLRPGDALILNDSKVLPARLHARNPRTGGAFEILLLEETAPNDWWAMLRPGKRARAGTRIELLDRRRAPSGFFVMVTEINEAGHRRLRFEGPGQLRDRLDDWGEPPLPPYIRRADAPPAPADYERYQTVYARPAGSVAAPTAGLHFTPELLARMEAGGVRLARVTLHVGAGTFAPVKADRLEDHVMHEERFVLPPETAAVIAETRARGGRVVAVGTTALRVLESVARQNHGKIVPASGRTRLFIYPPSQFHAADALLTNFHLPKSTLLMLVGAFAAPGRTEGRDLVLRAYAEAIRERYRFFSYGDAMLLF
jgi:S-adenosylmethionine:tRNA ribosyltransferase-isomerase